MQIGDSSMVEHVSRSHKVPSSNLGRLLLFASFRLQSTLQNFFVVLGLVVVRAINPIPRPAVHTYPRVQSSQSFCRISLHSLNILR